VKRHERIAVWSKMPIYEKLELRKAWFLNRIMSLKRSQVLCIGATMAG
jgi:hypothetical protein